MGIDDIDWKSFWDLGTPDEVADAFVKMYGQKAIESAEECIQTATQDGRTTDVSFWEEVVAVLKARQLSRLN